MLTLSLWLAGNAIGRCAVPVFCNFLGGSRPFGLPVWLEAGLGTAGLLAGTMYCGAADPLALKGKDEEEDCLILSSTGISKVGKDALSDEWLKIHLVLVQ